MQVLKTNLADLGWIRTAPYLVMFATSNAGAWLGDYLITSRKASTAGARKTVNTLGALLCSFTGRLICRLQQQRTALEQ